MRLVDADVLKAKQQEDADLFIGDNTLSGKSRRDEALNAVANIINAPTVDAVEVVRCKDCVYFWDGVCTAHTDAICTDENEFCSWGERR